MSTLYRTIHSIATVRSHHGKASIKKDPSCRSGDCYHCWSILPGEGCTVECPIVFIDGHLSDSLWPS